MFFTENKESDTTEQLNWTESLKYYKIYNNFDLVYKISK